MLWVYISERDFGMCLMGSYIEPHTVYHGFYEIGRMADVFFHRFLFDQREAFVGLRIAYGFPFFQEYVGQRCIGITVSGESAFEQIGVDGYFPSQYFFYQHIGTLGFQGGVDVPDGFFFGLAGRDRSSLIVESHSIGKFSFEILPGPV